MKALFRKKVISIFLYLYNIALWVIEKVTNKEKPAEKKEKTVVLTGTFYSSNWIESHVVPLAKSKNCKKLFLVSSKQFTNIDGISIVCPPVTLEKIIGNVPSRLFYFMYIVVKVKPDIVGGFHLLFNGMIAQLVAKIANAQSLYFCVGGPAEVIGGGIDSENKLFGKQDKPDFNIEEKLIRVVRGFDHVITMGSSAKQYFKDKNVNATINIVSGGINDSKFNVSKVDPKYDFIFIGRLAKIKRIDIYLQAIKLLVEAGHKPSAVIVGDGELKDELEMLSRTLDISDCVEFVGAKADIEYWHSISKVFVLTSDSEGLSLALIEAMMSGLPAVVSDVGDLSDIVVDGSNGFLVDSREPRQFMQKMELLLTDSNLYKKYSNEAKKTADRYKIENTTKLWDNILGAI